MEDVLVTVVDLDEVDYQSLAQKVKEGYDIDKNSLSSEYKTWAESEKLVAMLPEAKGGKFDNAANVNLPVILNSAIVFNARAYPAFFPANDVVKCQVVGDDSGHFDPLTTPLIPDPKNPDGFKIPAKWEIAPGAKAERATRISQHMSWQLTSQMSYWVEDMDRMLTLLPIYGCLFKKVYYDSYSKKNCSILILPQYLVVHNETRDLESAPRITHCYGLYPYEMQERIGSGYFKEFSFINNNLSEQHEFLEQHLRYDLDDDGYDEPLGS